jgi:TPR repeat protein
MKMLKALVLVLLFTMNAMPYGQAEDTVSWMMAWPNPDPCGGEECGSSDELMVRAESGDANAQFLLAYKYETGDGVAKDDSAAVQWYTKAADLGSVIAKLSLALRYKNGVGADHADKNPSLAFAYAKNAAELGHPLAQIIVGRMYLDGVGVDSNVASGMQWLTASAEQGNAIAQSDIGEIYMKGDYGQTRDWQKAVAWFIQSSKTQKDPRVDRWNIGFMYHEGGNGITPDAEESMKWFAATGMNQKEADVTVGLYYTLQLFGIEQNYAKALHYFTVSPAHSLMAASVLGDMYANGLGVEKNNVEADRWYALAKN